MPNVIELRIMKYLTEFGQNEYEKLLGVITKKKQYFNSDFFHKGISKALNDKNVKALIQLANMNSILNRFIEAEYILTKAYEIDDSNQDLIYYMIDIYCKRHAFFHALQFVEQLDPNIDYKYLKSKIKIALISGNSENLEPQILVLDNDEFNNNELTFLLIQYSERFKNNEILYKILSSNNGHKVLSNFSKRYTSFLKRMLYRVLINRMGKIS